MGIILLAMIIYDSNKINIFSLGFINIGSKKLSVPLKIIDLRNVLHILGEYPEV